MRGAGRWWQGLAAHPAAVDGEDGAGDVVAGGGGEEEGGAGEVVGLAPAAGGDAFEDLAVAGFVGLEGFGVGGGEVAGRDGVDLDAFGGPLVGEGLGELGDAAFGGGVGGDADAALEGEQGGDVDDLAGGGGAGGAAGDHVAGGELRELEDAGEVDLEDVLPVVERGVFGGVAADGAGVVDEDVAAAEGGEELVEEVRGAGGGGEVGGEGDGFAAGGVDGGGGGFGGAAVAVAGDGGAGLGEGEGDGGAEAARRAGDEGDFVVETEAVEDAGRVGHD